MDKRRFGVEIECGINNRDKHEEPGGTGHFMRRKFRENGFGDRWGDVGYDGTEIEIRSPILQGASGISELKDAMALIRECGGYVTGADGMHTHHEAPEFRANPHLRIQLVKSWAANQDAISQMLHPNRRANSYCYPWSPGAIEHLEQNGNYHDGGLALSLRQLRSYGHGTIEIRQHQGCLDGDAAEDWIKFGQAFLRSVVKRKRAIATCSDPEVLLKRVRVAPKALESLALKAKGQKPLNPVEDPNNYEGGDSGYDYDDDYYDDDIGW